MVSDGGPLYGLRRVATRHRLASLTALRLRNTATHYKGEEMNHDLRTPDEVFRDTYGMDPMHAPLRGKPDEFDAELDGSALLRLVQRRLDQWLADRGEPHATGQRLMELLLEEERKLYPLRLAVEDVCVEFDEELGYVRPDDWDDFDFGHRDHWGVW